MTEAYGEWLIPYGLFVQVKLSEYLGKKYVILFFYPLDFTFVCPTGESDSNMDLLLHLFFTIFKYNLGYPSVNQWV